MNRNGYRHLSLRGDNGKKVYCRVHQLVAEAFIGPRGGLDTDHIDGNKENNYSSNLQYLTRRENTNKGGASKLKANKLHKSTGVYYEYDRKKWRSSAYINGRTRYLGRFATEKEASEAYQLATA